jgi:hypothetical protein
MFANGLYVQESGSVQPYTIKLPTQRQSGLMESFMVFGLLSSQGRPGNKHVLLSTFANGLKLQAAGFMQPGTINSPTQLQFASMLSFMVFGLLSLHGLPGKMQVPLSTVAAGL